MLPLANAYGFTWSVGGLTATAGTAITAFIPPYRGGGGGAFAFTVDSQLKATWNRGTGAGFTHLAKILYTTSTTQHTVTVLRPLNWTYFTANVAKNSTALTVAADPGVYSTNYQYQLPNGLTAPGNVADNAAAAGDYIMYQLQGGTWILDTVASGFSAGAITATTGTPNITGAVVLANSPLFFFGVAGDTDPATGQKHWATKTTASTNRIDLFQDYTTGGLDVLHAGDPMVIYSDNSTAAGALDHAVAFYGRL